MLYQKPSLFIFFVLSSLFLFASIPYARAETCSPPDECKRNVCPDKYRPNSNADCTFLGNDYICCTPPVNCSPPNSCQRGGCSSGTQSVAGDCSGLVDGVCCAPTNPESVIVNLNSLIDDTLGGLKFKFKSSDSLGAILTAILPFVYGVAGFTLLLFLIAGGFGYLTSAGDPKKTESAKNTLTMAIVGFGLVVAAYWITQVVSFVLGLKSAF
ncbi:MAG: hypothetical protein UV61_C0010G0010 [Candidatus Gottesmanbacteria bacterium GW2011_GWB1_43_11]|uniref:Uncharacterized protein n=1 Tax=Candidatus Gottesmanbacteria bacterium GW2011_GWB1_43_11 TaxID=1618446 RepID=A0A0G1CLS9_9BACT|nr:MAG: hypothetical protein UV04_C0012G0010 [Candidatus Gottesmanbacteria bacterium GW2011_GWA2_42_16]KKS53525.1 MAG: hypothetical protein UV17_C0035G0010 [Candidatus Gottesmanbacteria bacterium GW2011_GWA1_42_26]KKS81200.1 MAG: hypothetical protein UV55_C0018G0010 [Candidatus Gottesmanbacteria bacterium GW2011_GWC1_43_10]KKS86459.1 MAG: hypothetical protein UV61_C0010G0010 [Candidatus Gottesmanbacteria bacterium GW2011_GWB1_43_11]OGG10105.1 MAG: hypothetical protein A2699_03635 [Candidatus Go